MLKDLPEGDVYLIENYMKMPSNVNVAGANLFYIKLQMLAMLIALINSKSNNSSSNIGNSSKTIYLIFLTSSISLSRSIM